MSGNHSVKVEQLCEELEAQRSRHAEELLALQKALEATQQLSQAGDEAMKRQVSLLTCVI